MLDPDNILIVTHDDKFLRELTDSIQSRGYHVSVAENGSSALNRVERGRPDIVIMDAHLDDMTSADLVDALKRKSNHIESIILGDDASQEVISRAIAQGSYGYIPKPYHLDHVLHVIQRIFEWIRTQEEMRIIEDQYRTLTESMRDIVWMMDLDFRILWANPSMFRLMGYSFDEIIDSPYEKIIKPYSQDVFYLQCMENLKPEFLDDPVAEIKIHGEFEYVPKDRHHFWCDTVITLLRDDGGRPSGLMGVGRDITERRETEIALEKERRLLRTLIDNLPDFIYAKDLEGRKTLSNRTDWEQIGAKSEKEILGKTDLELFPREIGEKLFADDMSVIQNEVPILKTEEHLRGVDGKDFWLLTSKIPLRDQEGKVIGLVGIGLDITDKKIAEVKLLEQYSWFKGILDSTGSPIFSIDREYRYTSFNDTHAKAMRQYFNEEIALGKSFLDVQHPLMDLERAKANFDKALGGELFTDEYFLPKISADNAYFEVTYSPILSMKNEIQGVAVFIHDITKRLVAEKTIRQSEEKLSKIFNAGPDAILLVSLPEGRIFEINEAAVEIFGYGGNELIDRTTEEIGLYESLEDRTDIYITLFKHGFVRNKVTRLIRKSGDRFWASISGNIVNITDKYFGLFMVRDVTQQKILESRLYEAQKLESIGQLAAGIAHEINTPTQFVGDNLRFLQAGFSDLLSLCSDFRCLLGMNKEAGQHLENVEAIEKGFEKADLEYLISEIPLAIQQSLEGTSRISVIVNAMRSFSHPGGERTAVDLNKAIQNTATVARNEWKYVAEMEMDLQEGLPPVICYPDELNQVFLNIIVNAAQAIAEKKKSTNDPSMGRIAITTRQDGKIAEITIRDTGSGIPETIRAKIFDPFFTTKGVGKGTGQGLSISYNVVVNKHHGTLTFNSEIGEGTTFIIRIPINPEE